MKKTIVLSIVLCAITTIGFTQNHALTRQLTSDLYLVDEYIQRGDKGMSYMDSKDYIGTPYNNESYLPGKVYGDDVVLMSDIAIRYNVIEDEMEIKESLSTPDNEAKALVKSADIFVKIVNDIFVFVPFEGDDENGGYFQVIEEGGQASLFKKLKKKFTKAQIATSSITRDVPAKFKDDNEYFVVNSLGKFTELPSSKKKALLLFGDKKDQIKEFMKKSNLQFDEEADLIRIFKYYNSI